MKPFHTVAVPHRDILEGRLTMDVFAADLWQVCRRQGPDEYRDADTFFRKTFVTQGLQNLLDIVEKRLAGRGGDPVIQIQTPFGGGKTHSLIAMYHKAVEWRAKQVVMVGTAPGGQKTLWGWLEEQLTGKIDALSGPVSPGKIALLKLLEQHQPVLILMDEILEYAVKAAGTKVGESTLAAQTLAFIQELGETVSGLDKACLVVTIPSSVAPLYDQNAERLFLGLQMVAGRIEKIYTPIADSEIASIIRSRLFSSFDQPKAKEVVDSFIEYAEREGILPFGSSAGEYRDRFLASYPFMPEVVDVLYQRWGSFGTFQRTRGVLRLLSLVVHTLRNSAKTYIGLSDFDLGNQEIRQELLKHIGSEFNSVIASDITEPSSGAQKVNGSLGNAYRGLSLGTSAATSIFLYSFSGGHERGATLAEVKRAATTTENPASVVAEAVEQLKARLFFMQSVGERLFFSNKPNLNKTLLNRIENLDDSEVIEAERELLISCLSRQKLKVTVWQDDPAQIQDTDSLQLLILRDRQEEVMKDIIRNKGQTPRVYGNALFFLYPHDNEKTALSAALKKRMAYESIEEDQDFPLTEEQRRELAKVLKKCRISANEALRRAYRMAAVPSKDGLREIDLGVPTYGENKNIDDGVYDKLRSEGLLLENLAPLVIREKYLAGKEYVSTEAIFQSALKTPGEPRPISKSAIEKGIREGVKSGLFGLGELEGVDAKCLFFQTEPSVAFGGKEVLICDAKCVEQKKSEPIQAPLSPSGAPTAKVSSHPQPGRSGKTSIVISFRVPKGKVSSIMGVMNYLQSRFEGLDITLTASGGEITLQEYDDKVMEAFRQAGIEVREG